MAVDYMNVHQAVVFSILMQHGRGIVGKSPDYVNEKVKAVFRGTEDPLALLDGEGQQLYARWYADWFPESDRALDGIDIKAPIPKPGG